MDNEMAAAAVEPSLPKSAAFSPIKAGPIATTIASTAGTAAIETSDRNGVFRHLVGNDSDITGLVAYSIYKQNKLDWLSAFETAKGRSPDDAELASYIIGEGTPRRLATYRHLAEATLAGHGPDVEGGQKSPATAGPDRPLASVRS